MISRANLNAAAARLLAATRAVVVAAAAAGEDEEGRRVEVSNSDSDSMTMPSHLFTCLRCHRYRIDMSSDQHSLYSFQSRGGIEVQMIRVVYDTNMKQR